MLELDRDLVARTLLMDGVPEQTLEMAVDSVFEAHESEEEDPILELLGPDGVASVVSLNVELATRGMGIEQRAEVIEERIADILGTQLSMHAEELEEAMTATSQFEDLPRLSGPAVATPMQPRLEPRLGDRAPSDFVAPHQEPLELELRRLDLFQAAGLLSPAAVKFLRLFLTIDVDTYASLRSGCATGDNGKKLWKRKRRRLCVVATTAGAHVAVKLLWWTIFSQSVVSTLVVGAHFRGLVPVIPNGAEPLRVGAHRNGITISKTKNASVVAKVCVFTDKDPNLKNVKWFGHSKDAESGINLYVTGTA